MKPKATEKGGLGSFLQRVEAKPTHGTFPALGQKASSCPASRISKLLCTSDCQVLLLLPLYEWGCYGRCSVPVPTFYEGVCGLFCT